jgi:hypothetical protein
MLSPMPVSNRINCRPVFTIHRRLELADAEAVPGRRQLVAEGRRGFGGAAQEVKGRQRDGGAEHRPAGQG